jgi:hypothetical protein
MKASTKNTLLIVGVVAALTVGAYVVLKPRATAGLYIPTQCTTPTGSMPCSYDDGFGTRCF